MCIHGSLRMQECIDESEICNYQRSQSSNNKFINGSWGVRLTWLDCNWSGIVVVLFKIDKIISSASKSSKCDAQHGGAYKVSV